MNKYRISIEVECDEEIERIDDVLEGSWLYNDDFRGAITKKDLKVLKGGKNGC